ncbi:MAG: hypothetical protein IH623_27815 [Verrucomicrobia bacterium]|nr:hypothetical protein [Verrucomicrobiota bacterium]
MTKLYSNRSPVNLDLQLFATPWVAGGGGIPQGGHSTSSSFLEKPRSVVKAVFSSAVAVIAFCGCAVAPIQIPGENVRSKVLHYSDFSQFLETREQVSVSQIRFQGDSLGSKLFISFFFRKGNEPVYRTLIATRDGIREVPGNPRVWYDDQENRVFRLEGVRKWYEGEGRSERFFSRFEDANYIFKNGPAIPFKEISEIEGVSGGDFVLLRFRERPGWMVSTSENPRRAVIELPNNFAHPRPAYATADELIIFGARRQPDGGYTGQCLIYQRTPAGYQLSEEIPIPWAGNVYDLYPKTGDALISGTATKFAGYYRFNIRTKKKTRFAAAAAESLFLKEDVIRTLDAAIRGSK